MEREKNKSVLMLCILCLLLSFMATSSYTQETGYQENKIEIALGYNFLINQSVYGFNSSTGLELSIARQIKQSFKAEIGVRMEIDPILSDGFIRGIVSQRFGTWRPAIGLETGMTNRTHFESSTNLLKESREATLKDIGYSYLSTHIEPLSFQFKKKFNLSLLELDIGSHFKHLGRTMRAQIVLVRIKKIL